MFIWDFQKNLALSVHGFDNCINVLNMFLNKIITEGRMLLLNMTSSREKYILSLPAFSENSNLKGTLNVLIIQAAQMKINK